MIVEKIKALIKRNKFQVICLSIFLAYLSYDFFSSEYELKNFGQYTDATVIESRKLRMNGSCHVKIVYETKDKETKTKEGTLYYDENCIVGKRIKIQYSTKSDLWDPIEE